VSFVSPQGAFVERKAWLGILDGLEGVGWVRD